ncbi:unnamed protein product [Adineta ricciae]|uniref:F-box domain-containing protein n=1 Tax=Adineta ricciae TaxID=249248 RepID=A0A816ENF4_ADIRI|nr:unnamed protein product [Adineta ricciae]
MNDFNILDLPDEILLMIFNKLNTIDVFRLVQYVNRRFYELSLDGCQVQDMQMTTVMGVDTHYKQISPIDTNLPRICRNILPKIHDKVQKLTVDQSSMIPVLHAADYPQLYSLTIIDIEEEFLHDCLSNNIVLRDLLIKQITNLNIDIKCRTPLAITGFQIFELIICLCENLTTFNFGDMLFSRERAVGFPTIQSRSYSHSALVELRMKIETFFDLVYLLDGRFPCLSTLIVHVYDHSGPTNLDGIKQLSTLKYFSLCGSLYIPTPLYDPLIVPLLSGMINLEKLQLCLRVVRLNSNYIDGSQLYDQFLCSMSKLKRFTFDIKTIVRNQNVDIELSSNEQIQRSFVGKFDQQVFSYINSNSSKLTGVCRICSLPYDFRYFFNVNNYFQGGRFEKVRQLRMKDSIGFTYELFQRVAQGFPFLKYLYIINMSAMKNKPPGSLLLTFPYLTYLDIDRAHDDYILLFLLKKHAFLPRLSYLSIEKKPLKTITNDFTIDSTDFNFSELKTLIVGRSFVPPANFHVYFPILVMYE